MTEKKAAVQPVSEQKPRNFLSGVKHEMKKVMWPTKHELVSYTCVVAFAVFVVCALIWICDSFFARLFQIILK